MDGSYKQGHLRRPQIDKSGKDLVYGQVNAGKYLVAKVDGSIPDLNAQYFVLRVDADPHARAALNTYAKSVRFDNPQLADDIEHWLDELERLVLSRAGLLP